MPLIGLTPSPLGEYFSIILSKRGDKMEYRRGSHSLYDLKYHIVFCTKYRYRVLTGQVAARTREIIREICSANYIDIVSGSMSPDHVHLLLSIPPSISISKALQYIKGKSSRKLLQEFSLLRKRYWGQHLWARGYFVVSVGNVNTEEVQKYIENQEAHHKQDDFKISEF
jgi:putative transposase